MSWLLLLMALLSPRPAGAEPSLAHDRPLRHPIVLVHGATMKGSRLSIGPWDLGEYFSGVSKFFAEPGTPVYAVELSTDSSIGERAAVLKNYLETDLRGQSVNIVAHSLGGLDARYAISILKSLQIVSLTTIGTPHRGTPLADWAMEQIHGNTWWYRFFRLVGFDMAGRRFLPEITTKGMKLFNSKVPDAPGVKYFSVRTRAKFGRGTMSGLLWFPAHWLESEHSPLAENGHDGMVPYDSQGWGREIATSSSLDHLGQMNHHELRMNDLEREAREMYVSIYRNLEKEGL